MQTSSLPKSVSPPALSGVPKEYHDLKEVLSKELAISLSPHCPYDCATVLLPGAPLYSLFHPERERLWKPIFTSHSMQVSTVHPSLLLVLISFCVQKKTDFSDRAKNRNTYYHESRLHLSHCREPQCSQNPTFRMHTIWFESERWMNGRPLSTFP